MKRLVKPKKPLGLLEMPPQGVELTAKNAGKTKNFAVSGNAGGNIQKELLELQELWLNLPVRVRQKCLDIVRQTHVAGSCPIKRT